MASLNQNIRYKMAIVSDTNLKNAHVSLCDDDSIYMRIAHKPISFVSKILPINHL